jgi:hypothetical protein
MTENTERNDNEVVRMTISEGREREFVDIITSGQAGYDS